MTDSRETLAELIERRLTDLATGRGRDGQLTLREAYSALPSEQQEVSYEVVRRARAQGHTNIGDRALRTIASMLQVDPHQVAAAAGRRAPGAPLTLPERANQLGPAERALVLDLLDNLLDAARHAPDAVILDEALARPEVLNALRARLAT